MKLYNFGAAKKLFPPPQATELFDQVYKFPLDVSQEKFSLRD